MKELIKRFKMQNFEIEIYIPVNKSKCLSLTKERNDKMQYSVLMNFMRLSDFYRFLDRNNISS